MKSIAVLSLALTLPLAGCVREATKAHRGHLSIWPEVEIFTPCGSDKALWLDYDKETRQPLASRHWELQKEPYGTTFAVLRGEVGPKLDCGFCENYEGSFKVLGVDEHRASGPNDCDS